MVADLEDVDRRQESARQEDGLDRCLGIAGKKRRESAHPKQQHDRSVVDIAIGKGRGRIGHAGIDHLEAGGGPQREPVTRPKHADRNSGVIRIGQ